ncbi:MAG: GNAT family N-acetyltransferase [Anaerosomatales bacterium]|nr:GNAT family N-acetyltransferase [Anaerosomatales bacterium]
MHPFKIVPVTPENRGAFVEWCLEHGAEHDDSYTQPHDLAPFPTPGEIAALALLDGEVVGAAALMIDGFADAGLGRFRILHATRAEAYGPLVEHVVARTPAAVRHVYCFLPEGAAAAEALAPLGFAPTRYAIVLERAPGPVDAPRTPAGVDIRAANPGDASAWATVINAAFADSPGHYPMTEQRAREHLGDERAVASFLAWRGGEPIGLVAVWRDEEAGEDAAEIATLGVVPSAQGRGIGRALLRQALMAAANAGLPRCSLSTGTVNRPALGLYTSEGFAVVDTRVCWGRDLDERPAPQHPR